MLTAQTNLSFILECKQYTDCPNGGQNYNCISNGCICASGYALENDACVGMLSDQCFFLTCTQAYFLPQYAKRILNRIYDLLDIDTLVVLQTSNYK